MMNKFPKSLLRFPPQLLHFLGLPIFFLMFVLYYEPATICGILSTEVSSVGNDRVFAFNLSLVSAIILTVLAMSRILFYLLREVSDMKLLWYAIWCFEEVFVMTCFIALYFSLIDSTSKTYLDFLGQLFTCNLSVLSFPYIILTLSYYLHDEKNRRMDIDEGRRLKFYDSRHLLRFVTLASSILFVEAAENYVIIHYEENGVQKKYQLRNTMKQVEAVCQKAGLIRAHRSYLVNPTHVAQLKKEKNGMFFAELDAGTERTIPVSKKYYEVLSQSL